MYWWMEKLEDNDSVAIYAYGLVYKVLTGKIKINKITHEITKIKVDDNDDKPLSATFCRLVRHIIPKAGYPNVRSLATG